MFTQLNQYHVVLEVKPGFQKNPLDLRDLFIRTGAGASGGSCRAGVRRHFRVIHGARPRSRRRISQRRRHAGLTAASNTVFGARHRVDQRVSQLAARCR